MYFKYLIKTILFSFVFLLFISGSGGAQTAGKKTPGFVIDKEIVEIPGEPSEGLKSSKFTIKLATKPTADVTVTLKADLDPADGKVLQGEGAAAAKKVGELKLIFTKGTATKAGTWNTVQTVTVYSELKLRTGLYRIVLTADSVDDKYKDLEKILMVKTGKSTVNPSYDLAFDGDVKQYLDNPATPITFVRGTKKVISFTTSDKLKKTTAYDTYDLAYEPYGSPYIAAETISNAITFTKKADEKVKPSTKYSFEMNAQNIADGEDTPDKDIQVFIRLYGVKGTTKTVVARYIFYLTLKEKEDAKPAATKAGVKVTSVSDDKVLTKYNFTEKGEEKELAVVLKSQPQKDVTVKLVSSNKDSLEIDTNELKFTKDDWDTEKKVVLTSKGDKNTKGYKVNITIESEDTDYKSLKSSSIAITNNYTAGVKITSDGEKFTKYNFTEKGEKKELAVVLKVKPVKEVKVKLVSSNTDSLEIDTNELKFTKDDWDKEQKVVLTSKGDKNAKEYKVNITIESEDASYKKLKDSFIAITNNYTDGTTTTTTPTTPTTLISQEKVSKIISKYLDNKVSLSLANQPDISERFSRLGGNSSSSGRISAFGGSASMQLPVTVGLNDKQAYFYGSLKSISNVVSGNNNSNSNSNSNNVAQQNRFDVWTQGSISRFKSSSEKGTFGILYGGVDYVAGSNVLIGGIAQIDWFKQEGSGESADEVVKGFGWMVGPYGVVKLHENVFANFRFAWGLSNNNIEVKEAYKDDFATSRWLVSGALVGDYTFNNWNVRPAVRVNYLNENQASYVDKSGLKMPAQKKYQGVLKVGPRISHSFLLDNGSVAMPWLELEGEYLFAKKDSKKASTLASTLTTEKTKKNNLSGNIKLGFDFNFLGGATLAVSGNFGGFNSDLRKYGASLYINIPITN